MKVVSIVPMGPQEVYDISVQDAEHYILENGVVTHNTGIYYSSSTIFIVGRKQEKDGTDIVGWNYVLNVEKSRYVREKSKVSFLVTYEGGINKWSGLLDLALESGHVVKPKNGWYQVVGTEKLYREKDTNTKEFWLPVLQNKEFTDFVTGKYKLSTPVYAEGEDE